MVDTFLAIVTFVLFVAAIVLDVYESRKEYITEFGVVLIVGLLGVGTIVTFVLYFFLLDPKIYLLPSMVTSVIALVLEVLVWIDYNIKEEQWQPRR